eukprot:51458-Chlamydomonas_euryale.AAC.10
MVGVWNELSYFEIARTWGWLVTTRSRTRVQVKMPALVLHLQPATACAARACDGAACGCAR